MVWPGPRCKISGVRQVLAHVYVSHHNSVKSGSKVLCLGMWLQWIPKHVLQVWNWQKRTSGGQHMTLYVKIDKKTTKYVGNFVLGHQASVGSQSWQSHATKLIAGIYRGQKAGMSNLNWSKRRSGGQIICFEAKNGLFWHLERGDNVSQRLSHQYWIVLWRT